MTAPDIPNLTDLALLHSDGPSHASQGSASRATGLFTGSMTAGDAAPTKVLVKTWEGLDRGSRDRFAREWRFVGILDGHPGIAEVHDGGTNGTDDGGTDDDQVWLVRDYVDGTSLAAEIAGPAPTTADDVADRVAHHHNVATVIAYAHRNGVSHSALKPTNVFRTDEGQAIVTDFGLPGVTDHTAADRDDPAVAPWLAPEIGVTGRPSPPADVYALGAMLFASLTGAPPTGTEADALALRNLPGIGAQLVPLLTAAIAADPRKRPVNAGVFAEALARVAPAPAVQTVEAQPADVPTVATPVATTRPSATQPPRFSPRTEPTRETQPSRPSVPKPKPAAAEDPRPVPGYTQSATPVMSDEQRRSRRTTVLAAVSLAAAALLVAAAWSFLIDLTSSDSTSPVETASVPADGESTDSNDDTADENSDDDDTAYNGNDDTAVDDPLASSTSVAQTGLSEEPDPSAERAAAERAESAGDDASTDDRSPSRADTDSTSTSSADRVQPGEGESTGDADSEIDPAPARVPTPEAPATAPSPPAPTSQPSAPVPTLAATQEPIVAPTPEPGTVTDADVSSDYEGALFSAALPDGWVPTSENRDVGYGYRTHFRGPNNDFIYIDLTPPTHHDGSETIEQSARRIAAQTPTAGPVVKLTIEDKTTWWFEYTGDDGSARIDVFFAIGDTGYAVVGGSHDDPKAAYEALIDFVRTLEQV